MQLTALGNVGQGPAMVLGGLGLTELARGAFYSILRAGKFQLYTSK